MPGRKEERSANATGDATLSKSEAAAALLIGSKLRRMLLAVLLSKQTATSRPIRELNRP